MQHLTPQTTEDGDSNRLTPEKLISCYENARRRRGTWESLWQDCYEYALPRRDGALSSHSAGHPAGEDKQQRLFDGTAPDAVEQLAASLMAELTPAWSRWLDFVPGPELDGRGRGRWSRRHASGAGPHDARSF